MRVRAVLVVGACFGAGILVALGCGGRTSDGEDAGPSDDAGNPLCTTPEGYGICGPATPCKTGRQGELETGTACQRCECPNRRQGDGLLTGFECAADDPLRSVGVCDGFYYILGTEKNDFADACDDGFVRYDVVGEFFDPNFKVLSCVPYSLGLLVSRYVSDRDRLRYADFGFFTGAPLPRPTTCPATTGFQLCGSSCGACPTGQRCNGRSPLHPYGFCVDNSIAGFCSLPIPTGHCTQGQGCFKFKVEADAQAIADLYGVCLPLAQCQALATGLPGGGTCTPQ